MKNHDKILGEIKRLAHKIFAGLPVSVYLYGSRARGDSRDNSDWDILILTDDSLTTQDAFERFAYPFTEIGWHLGEQITPLLYTQSEWNLERGTPFYINVQKEAILL